MNLNLKTVLSIIVMCSIVFACKKKSSTTAPTASASTPTPTSTGSGMDGSFSVINLYNDYVSSPKDSASTTAAQPITNPVFGSIGSVTMNGDSLGYFFGQYSSTLFSSNTIPPYNGSITWKITGGSGFSQFTYTTAKPMPHVGFINLGFNSFSKSSNLIINHGLISCDSIKYKITDDDGYSVTKSVGGNTSGYTFASSALSGLGFSTNASIQIVGWNTVFSNQGGKDLVFINTSQYSKEGIAIN